MTLPSRRDEGKVIFRKAPRRSVLTHATATSRRTNLVSAVAADAVNVAACETG